MKKSSIIIASILLIGFAAVSCKSHETCPAYSKVKQDTETVIKKN